MRHDRLLILGGFLVGAMAAVGCSGSSSNNGSGGRGAGGSGAGGSAIGGKGAGGSSMDAGTDHGSTVDAGSDTSGAGGSADANGDLATDKGTEAGASDTAADLAVDTATDTPADTAQDTGGPCVTDYGAGNPVQFAFNGGVNSGWTTFATHNSDQTGLTTSLGASFTEGRSCAGSLLLGLNFTAYGQSGAIEHFYGVSPNGANWTGFKTLHAYIKLETATLSEVSGVNFYMKSGNQVYYQSGFLAGATLADWQPIAIDLTRAPNSTTGLGVVINDVQLIGFELFLNSGPAVGAPATPSQVLLLADDIWLEAAPPSDAGGQ